MRTPEERRGDLNAQVAANRRGSQRLSELAEKYGTDNLLRIMGEVMDYSDTMMRALLRDMPDGEGAFDRSPTVSLCVSFCRPACKAA